MQGIVQRVGSRLFQTLQRVGSRLSHPALLIVGSILLLLLFLLITVIFNAIFWHLGITWPTWPTIVYGLILVPLLWLGLKLLYPLKWTGFGASQKIFVTTEDTSLPKITHIEENQPPKTFWDWLQLLIIPIILLAITGWFNAVQTQNSFALSNNQHLIDMQLAVSQQQESILDTYQKDIAGLILSQPLDTSPQGVRGRLAARAYTLEAIFRLDSFRKGRLIQFLYGAQLLQTDHPVVDLRGADLSQVSLSGLDLHRINLSGAILKGADLRSTNLSRAYLLGVDLRGAKLGETKLIGAYLWRADLEGLDLRLTNPQGADLKDANVRGTIIPKVPLAPSPTCNKSESDSGDDTSKWTTFLPGDKKARVLDEVPDPSFDGNALQISNPGGDPNTNVGASYSWPQNYIAQTLQLSMCFYLTDLTPVQAFTFSVNRWVNNQRYEMSLQYEAVGDGSLQQGTPPMWRIWTGQGWQLTQIGRRPLTEGKWYWLDLQGEIVNSQVHYVSFSLDGTPYPLDKFRFKPVPLQTKDGLNLGVQLAGNAQGDPYSIYLDNVNLKN